MILYIQDPESHEGYTCLFGVLSGVRLKQQRFSFHSNPTSAPEPRTVLERCGISLAVQHLCSSARLKPSLAAGWCLVCVEDASTAAFRVPAGDQRDPPGYTQAPGVILLLSTAWQSCSQSSCHSKRQLSPHSSCGLPTQCQSRQQDALKLLLQAVVPTCCLRW